MGAALAFLVIVTLMVLVIRVAAVALRITGLEESVARFQALSAFSGAGFTTRESEAITNYPVRRKIIAFLIITGNFGLLTVVATLVVSFVHTEGEVDAVIAQAGWLIGALALLWFLMLNRKADKLLCDAIGRLLMSQTILGKRRFRRVAQITEGYSVCEHLITDALISRGADVDTSFLKELGLMVLGVRNTDGELTNNFVRISNLNPGEALVLYGSDEAHDALERRSNRSEPGQHNPNCTSWNSGD